MTFTMAFMTYPSSAPLSSLRHRSSLFTPTSPLSTCRTTSRHRLSTSRVSNVRTSISMTGSTPPTPPPSSDSSDSNAPRKMSVERNAAPSAKKLVRNKPGMEPDTSAGVSPSTYANASPGDMVGAPEVGEGMGPRRGAREKKVTKAAAIQKSKGFADAWAEQNQGRPDVWLAIGAAALLTPILILVWAIATGVIPTGGLFE